MQLDHTAHEQRTSKICTIKILTNQFTGAWTHYTGTLRGTRTDHMVGYFQEISIESAHSSINHTIYIGIRVRQQLGTQRNPQNEIRNQFKGSVNISHEFLLSQNARKTQNGISNRNSL